MEKLKKTHKVKIKEEKSQADESDRRGFSWQNLTGQEGQLSIDVFQTDEELIIQSAIAGVKPEDLDISIESDTISIKGSRNRPGQFSGKRNYFYQECYWGPFSRKIITPVEIDASRAKAVMKKGILTLRMPKIDREKKRKITVNE